MHFLVSRLPRIEFGAGALLRLPSIASVYGTRLLIVTGGRSFVDSPHWPALKAGLSQHALHWDLFSVPTEPSPTMIDEAVSRFCQYEPSCVVGIGGGSSLDAAKAIAGLLKPGNSVMDHLEGVGPELPYLGPATPFIAIPTTAGTGSEATKNAVLSIHGEHGFKKSFRDEQLMAEWALIDPDLLASCPPAVLAANGMDAFTQLLESFVSAKANPFMDTLAVSGMSHVRDALLPWYEGTGQLPEHRASMAYAALLSGITLAHVGLGSVHGLASPLGAYFPIPHGVVCGTLVADATRVNIAAMLDRAPGHPALEKYAEVGRLLLGRSLNSEAARELLVSTLEDWTQRLAIPRLGTLGVSAEDIPRIVANSRGSSMKTNPIVLTDEEIARILWARL